jgi:hypothetical protein
MTTLRTREIPGIVLAQKRPPPTITASEFSEVPPNEPSIDAKVRPASLKGKQPSLGGVAATLAWQSHGDEIREMIASSYPQLNRLAPQTAFAKTAPDVAPTMPAATSPCWQEHLKAMSLDLAAVRQNMDEHLPAVRQSLDQLAAQLLATQQQMASDIANLKAAEQDVLEKIHSAPPPAASRVASAQTRPGGAAGTAGG